MGGAVESISDGGLYLENEINMYLNGKSDEFDKSWALVQDGMLAVTVQTNTCAEQFAFLVEQDGTDVDELCYGSSGYFSGGADAEAGMIENAKQAACTVSEQLSGEIGRHIPVLEAAFLTNAAVDAKKWAQ